MNRIEKCKRCLGVGKLTFSTDEGWQNPCPDCEGTGSVTIKPQPDHAEYNRGFRDGQDVLKESGDRDLQPDQSSRLLTDYLMRILEENIKASSFDSRGTEIYGREKSVELI